MFIAPAALDIVAAATNTNQLLGGLMMGRTLQVRASGRRQVRSAATVLAAAAITLAACSSGSDGAGGTATDAPGDTTSESAGTGDSTVTTEGGVDVTIAPETEMEATPGGTLRYGLEAEVDGLNPTTSALSAPGYVMANAVFETLAVATEDGGWSPWLAESMTPNDDFTVWTVKLRDGITFHDGTPLNADAVIANFEAQYKDGRVGQAVKPFYPSPDDGGTPVVKVDDLTVEYNLLDSNAYFPSSLTSQIGMVASPTWLAAVAEDGTLAQQPVGTGRFQFASRSEDSITKFVRYDNYWGTETYLDGVEFIPITDSNNRTDMLLNGDLDALHTTVSNSIKTLTETDGIENVLTDKTEESFAMMNTEVPPFNDLRVRQALTYATPQENYVTLVGLGVARRADQQFTPESKYYNPDLKQETDQPEKAADLIAAFCAEKGTEVNPVLQKPACTDGKVNIELQWSGPSVIQTQIADLLEAGWNPYFNITRDEKPQDEQIQDAALGAYNVVTWRQFGAEDPSADNVWTLCRTVGPLSLNWPRYCDEARDKLILDAQATTDESVRIKNYQEYSKALYDSYAYVFFIHTPWDNAFTSNVHGVCDRTAIDDPSVKLACSSNGRTWFDTVWIDQ